jgi:hypothetical protein
MANLDAERAYLRLRIGQRFPDELASGSAIPKEAIREEVEASPFIQLTLVDREQLVRELEESFTTTQRRGSAVRADYKPWLTNRRSEIDWYYWDRLRKYYIEGNMLPPQVVATLDAVTDEVLDYSGDPATPGRWARRGMVMGHVQSGKTTNYSALICKAADAGYKVVILLAGLTNSLRTQTQERIDETFIGRKSVFSAAVIEGLPLQNYATKKRTPAYGTSRDKDFTRDAAGVFFSLEAHNEPIIFVTKKNKRTLELLRDWLRDQAAGQSLPYPMLLIDDEADNASINTEKDPQRVTAINRVIREILGSFDRSTYIGYTATPFANIFIDPDSDTSMLDDDLFPKHFIKALDPPSNYIGADKVFAENGALRDTMVRVVDDFGSVLPLAHKSSHVLNELPESLREAIRVWCLTRGIRFLRQQQHRHCSMMINVSRFNDVQERVLGLVYAYLDKLRNAITANAGLAPGEIKDTNIGALRETFENEFCGREFGFGEVLRILPTALADTTVLTVNMRGGTLDYAKHRKTGLRVIAIGGLALSRGLTLEDLTVSYILRNTAASDTLMQMARWFGYRPGFADLCRVYLPQVSLDHYEEIAEAIDELRTEVKRMQLLRLTPSDFGLRVRQSPTAIRITAANKMRTARPMMIAQSYEGRHIEGFVLVNDDDVNKTNIASVSSFLAPLRADAAFEEGYILFSKVKGQQVLKLLDSFVFPDAHADLKAVNGSRSLLGDYVSDRLDADLETWDVAIPHLQAGSTTEVLGFSIPLRQRNKGTVQPPDSGELGTYRVYGNKNRIADKGDVGLGMSDPEHDAVVGEFADPDGYRGDRAYCMHRKRPLLLIHVVRTGGEPEGKLNMADPVISLSIALPRTAVETQSRVYQVNKVYVRQMELFPETEDDDNVMETGDA